MARPHQEAYDLIQEGKPSPESYRFVLYSLHRLGHKMAPGQSLGPSCCGLWFCAAGRGDCAPFPRRAAAPAPEAARESKAISLRDQHLSARAG